MDTCDFKSDLAFGKVGEQQVSTILTECNIKHGPNPDKYGHDILSEMGSIEVKTSNYYPLVEVYHDIRTMRLGWGYNNQVADLLVVVSDNGCHVINEQELLNEGYKQICKRLKISYNSNKEKTFKLALDNDILRVNKSTGNRNQSAWFKVNGIEMIDFEEYIRGWKIEQNNSWGFLKPDTGIRR